MLGLNHFLLYNMDNEVPLNKENDANLSLNTLLNTRIQKLSWIKEIKRFR